MRKFYLIFGFALLTMATSAVAQVSIEAAAPAKVAEEAITFEDKVKQNEVVNEFSNEAKRRAERAAIRKERNKIEFNATLNGSLSNFNSKWQQVNGNANAITGVANMLFTHSFTKGKFTISNKVTAKLGYTSKESEWTKSQDEWFIQTSPAYIISKSWNVGGSVSLRSQFANGWNSTDKAVRKRTSAGFAPAYLTLAVGVTYVCPDKKFPIKINLAPISMNATYVTNKSVRDFYFAEKFGADTDPSTLTPDQRNTPYAYGLTLHNGIQRYEGGSSIQVDFDKTFGKKGVFRYRTTLYSFYGWINEVAQQQNHKKTGIIYESIAPTVRWENTIDIKATKYISTQFYFQLYYNKAQNKSIQTQTVLGVGLAYTFKNK